MTICERTKDDIYNIIGQNIKRYRKLNNMTQRELAYKAAVSENLIAKLESKTHQPLLIHRQQYNLNILLKSLLLVF